MESHPGCVQSQQTCSPDQFQDGDPSLGQEEIQKGDCLFLVDMKDVYSHVPIHRDSRKFLQSVFKGWVF